MSAEDERAQFSERLRFSLAGLGWTKMSPTRIADNYNKLAGSGRTVTIHAVRKWLIGEAIPTQERIAVLAAWLQVQPDWLRFGPSARGDNEALISRGDSTLLRDLALLDPANKMIVQQMVGILLQASRKRGENERD